MNWSQMKNKVKNCSRKQRHKDIEQRQNWWELVKHTRNAKEEIPTRMKFEFRYAGIKVSLSSLRGIETQGSRAQHTKLELFGKGCREKP